MDETRGLLDGLPCAILGWFAILFGFSGVATKWETRFDEHAIA